MSLRSTFTLAALLVAVPTVHAQSLSDAFSQGAACSLNQATTPGSFSNNRRVSV